MKDIGSIAKTKESIEKYGFHIKKKFGQNFLVEPTILNKIVDSSTVTKQTNVIEIGPGLGSLTEKLVERANKVLAYEIDDELIPILKDHFKEPNNIDFIHGDFLKRDVNKDIEKYFVGDNELVVVANLPYYITTAIISKIVENIPKVSRIIVMLQYEVGMRICSKPNTKDYNSLSVAIQYKCNASFLFKVPSSVFIPKPKVDSAIIKLTMKEELLKKPTDETFFYQFVKNCFSQRRKTLKNNINNHYNIDKSAIDTILKKEGIPIASRAENLTTEEFIDLSDQLYQMVKTI